MKIFEQLLEFSNQAIHLYKLKEEKNSSVYLDLLNEVYDKEYKFLESLSLEDFKSLIKYVENTFHINFDTFFLDTVTEYTSEFYPLMRVYILLDRKKKILEYQEFSSLNEQQLNYLVTNTYISRYRNTMNSITSFYMYIFNIYCNDFNYRNVDMKSLYSFYNHDVNFDKPVVPIDNKEKDAYFILLDDLNKYYISLVSDERVFSEDKAEVFKSFLRSFSKSCSADVYETLQASLFHLKGSINENTFHSLNTILLEELDISLEFKYKKNYRKRINFGKKINYTFNDILKYEEALYEFKVLERNILNEYMKLVQSKSNNEPRENRRESYGILKKYLKEEYDKFSEFENSWQFQSYLRSFYVSFIDFVPFEIMDIVPSFNSLEGYNKFDALIMQRLINYDLEENFEEYNKEIFEDIEFIEIREDENVSNYEQVLFLLVRFCLGEVEKEELQKEVLSLGEKFDYYNLYEYLEDRYENDLLEELVNKYLLRLEKEGYVENVYYYKFLTESDLVPFLNRDMNLEKNTKFRKKDYFYKTLKKVIREELEFIVKSDKGSETFAYQTYFDICLSFLNEEDKKKMREMYSGASRKRYKKDE